MAKLKYFVESSQNKYCQYLAASAMKRVLEENWRHVSPEEKVAVRKYLTDYLLNANIVLNQDKQVVKMMILLLAKIAKLGWFDDPDIKTGIVPELMQILMNPSNSAMHKLIGLTAI